MIKKSRYKKLAILAKASCNIINEFGFKLFLKTAYSEFKKNKWSIFVPVYDNVDQQIMSEEVTYLIWLNYHKNKPESIKQMKIETQEFTYKPKFCVVISINTQNKEHLNETLTSLCLQVYNNFELSFSYSPRLSEEMKEILNRTDVVHDLKKLKISGQKISNRDFDYTTFVNCGDTLTEDALFRISKLLNKNNDIDIIYSDEDTITDSKDRIEPFFKPDWSPDLFLSMDYITNFCTIKNKLFDTIKINEEYGQAKLYDLLLQLSEHTNKISHIPTILSSVRKISNGEDQTDFKEKASSALSNAIRRRNINAKVTYNPYQTNQPTFRIKYQLDNEPRVSIIIPTKDNKKILKRCIDAISNKTVYKNYEIIIIDNNSTKEETLSYFRSLPYKIIRYELPFNFSEMNKLAVSKASGDYLLFLNDDTAPLEPNWLSEMVGICRQDGVGIVGSKLVHLNNTIQHAGIAILKTGAGFHPLQNIDSDDPGYFGFVNVTRNCSAVTGACLLIKKKVFDEIDGFDDNFDLYYGDTDLCMSAIKHGYRVVYTPYAVLLHQGSATIKENSSAFFAVENHRYFIKKWPNLKYGDLFYNPNLGWDYKPDVR